MTSRHSVGLSPSVIPPSVYAESSLHRHQRVPLGNNKTSQKKSYLTIMVASQLLSTIWVALLPTLIMMSLPTSLCTQRLRDTKTRYNITFSKLASPNPRLKDAPLLTWKHYRDEYLDACLALDGRGHHNRFSTCSGCPQSNPSFRCRDCFRLTLYCKACIVHRHHNEPLHFLEVLP